MSTAAEITSNFLDRFDGDGDGTVSKTEFRNALSAEGLSADTVSLLHDVVFANWDANHDAVLSKKEIQHLAERYASF